MANEILYSGAGDYTLAAALAQEIQLVLADRAWLWQHPAIVGVGDVSGLGSSVIKTPILSLMGVNQMAAVAEGSPTSNTDITDTSASITVARQALQRQKSDLIGIVNQYGHLAPDALAMDMMAAFEARFTAMITALLDGFSSTVGTSGVDMSFDDWVDAITTLEIAGNSVQNALAVLHPRQVSDLRQSLIAAGGPVQWRDDVAGQLNASNPGFAGQLLGVDIFRSSLVPLDGGSDNRVGGMFCRGALGYALGTPKPPLGTADWIISGPLMVEFERDAAYSYTKVVGNVFCGVGELQDAMGVEIATDA